MNISNARKILAMFLAIGMVSLTACSNGQKANDNAGSTANAENSGTKPAKVVTITHPTSWVGAHPFTKYFKEQLDKFNAKYGKEIKVEIEEVPGNGGELDEKTKVMISAGQMPDVIQTNAADIVNLAIKGGLLADLKPYINADQAWKASIDENDLADWSGSSDKWYAVTGTKLQFGYFYNKEMFKKAGLEAPAKTWEEFFVQLDKLKAAGVIPMALETKGAWVSDLWMISMFGTDGEAGNKLANTKNPDSYETPEFIKAANNLQRMFKDYANKDAIGMDYAGAANLFLREKAAIIANGMWMVPDFSDASKCSSDFKAKVGVALYPNDGMFSDPGSCWAIGSKDKDKIEAALKFVKFFTDKEGQIATIEGISSMPAAKDIDVSKLKIDPLLQEAISNAKDAKCTYRSPWRIYQAPIVSVLPMQLAALGYGKETAEQFAANLTKEGAKAMK